MTVSTTTVRSIHVGTGGTPNLATGFVFFTSAEIQVVSRVLLTGAETVLVEDTHYSVTGGGTPPVDGDVTPLHADYFPATVHWAVVRVSPLTQTLDYLANDSFPAETHEAGLDHLTLHAQERSDDASRSLRFPVSDATTLAGEIPDSINRASKALTFDASGNPTATEMGTASGTTVIASGSTEPRTLADRFAEVFNVKDYGAKGDGITVDTYAFRDAIDEAGLVGGTVYVPASANTYIVGPLYFEVDNVTFCGDGIGSSVLEASGPNYVLWVGNKVADIVTTGITVRDLGIIATNANTYALLCYYTQDCTFENLFITDPGGRGVYVTGTTVGVPKVVGCTFRNIVVDQSTGNAFDMPVLSHCSLSNLRATNSGAIGFSFSAGSPAHFADNNIDGLISDASTTVGISVQKVTRCNFSNLVVSNSTSAGMFIDGSVANKLSKCNFSNIILIDNGGGGIIVGSGAAWVEGISISNVLIRDETGGAGTFGMGIQGVKDSVFSNIRIEETSETALVLLDGASFCSNLTFHGLSIDGANQHGAPATIGAIDIQDTSQRIQFHGINLKENNSVAAARYEIMVANTCSRILFAGGIITPDNDGQEFSVADQTVVRVTGIDVAQGLPESVASAATVTLPVWAEHILLADAVDVDDITPSWAGRVVTIVLAATAKLKDGTGNLNLSADGPVTANDAISLICDGTDWYELSRSVNS